nr:phosphoribosylformylglycinamidine synthase [Bacteroidota bacterium]
MIHFFRLTNKVFILGTASQLTAQDIDKLTWLFGGTELIDKENLEGFFIGPRKEMITPWSTNAVEITQNMGINGISRIEEFFEVEDKSEDFDPMLSAMYDGLNQTIFTIDKQPDPIIFLDDIAAYNEKEGLALSPDEIDYL